MSNQDNQEYVDDGFDVLTSSSSVSQKSNVKLYQELMDNRNNLDEELKSKSQQVSKSIMPDILLIQELRDKELNDINFHADADADVDVDTDVDADVDADVDVDKKKAINNDWFMDPYQETNFKSNIINIYKPIIPCPENIEQQQSSSETKLPDLLWGQDEMFATVCRRKGNERFGTFSTTKCVPFGTLTSAFCGGKGDDSLATFSAAKCGEPLATFFTTKCSDFTAESSHPQYKSNTINLFNDPFESVSNYANHEEISFVPVKKNSKENEIDNERELCEVHKKKKKEYGNSLWERKNADDKVSKRSYVATTKKNEDDTEDEAEDEAEAEVVDKAEDEAEAEDEDVIQNSTDKLQNSVDIIQQELEMKEDSAIHRQVDIMQRHINVIQRELNRISRKAEKNECPTFLMSPHFPTIPRANTKNQNRDLRGDVLQVPCKKICSELVVESYSTPSAYSEYIPGKDREYPNGYYDLSGYETK
jgi:hypothetical protein